MKKLCAITAIAVFLLFCAKGIQAQTAKEIKIACVENSITEGFGLACQSKTAYPAILGSILGSGYSVLNCGRSSATLQKKSRLPYWNCKEFYDVFAYNPDIIIIKLGTNDSNSIIWNAENFYKDYQAMIDTFKTIHNKPKIFVCFPVPVYKSVWGLSDSIVRVGIIPAIKNIAKTNNLPIIDLYTDMSNQSENFSDGVHPNEKGARIMAEFIAKAITGNK